MVMTPGAKRSSNSSGREADDVPPSRLAPCTIQISLRDADLPFARHVLPHQVRVLGQHAADVLVTLNRPPGSVRSAEFEAMLADLAATTRQLRVVEVDYGQAAIEWVRATFFGGGPMPMVDSKGTPIYAYLEPFRVVEQPYLFHLDSDILLGGSGGRWLHEAIDVLRRDPGFLAAAPMSGPPRADGVFHSGGEEVATIAGPARSVAGFTGRKYLVDVARLLEIATPIPLRPSSTRWRRVRARLVGYPDIDNLERLVGRAMLSAGLRRVDLGGSGQVWSLHPLHKTPSFVAALPQLIAAVEAGDVPDGQRGHYNLHPSMLAQHDIPGRAERLRALRGSLHLGQVRPGSWA